MPDREVEDFPDVDAAIDDARSRRNATDDDLKRHQRQRREGKASALGEHADRGHGDGSGPLS
jgi:hypothetical protein